MTIVDLTKGPMVVEVPPKSLGSFDDMWFRWIIDAGAPGPDRGEGGKYLIVPPDYAGPLPEGGFYVGHSRTVRALYFGRSFLENDDPKPVVAKVKQTLIYPYTSGGAGTSIATALEGNVKLAVPPPISPTKFIESSGKSFNTIPPTDYGFYETINALVQEEPANGPRSRAGGTIGLDRHRQRQTPCTRRANEEDPYRRRDTWPTRRRGL